MRWLILWCTINFIQSDSEAWVKCGHVKSFSDRKDAIEYYQEIKKLENPDSSMALKRAGIYNVKFDSITKK